LNPNVAETHYNLAMALVQLDQGAAAVQEYNIAHRLNPKLIPAK
jgi:cytochrome c-type biogenesis protein CcmH/NrfG